MTKKITFGTKPMSKAPEKNMDEWVNATTEQPEAKADVQSTTGEQMKRLTIDIPLSLHARIKSSCALRGVKMADEIRVLLEKHFGG